MKHMAPADRKAAFHHVMRAAILIGIAFYIVYLQTTGKLTLYIAPRMTIYVKIASLALYVTAVFGIYEAFRLLSKPSAADCGCSHAMPSSTLRSALAYLLFIIPLGIAFLTPDTTIGSAMAANKGMTLSASQSLQQPADDGQAAELPGTEESDTAISEDIDASTTDSELAAEPSDTTAATPSPESGSAPAADSIDALFPSDEYTISYANLGKKLYQQETIVVEEKRYMEILTALDLFLDRFVGKTVTIEGFVYRDDTLTNNAFILGRFAVSCCAADAMPYGVMVQTDHPEQYGNDTWLRMTGTLATTTYNGNEIMLLQASKTEKIEPADDPYVYPNYDF
ncbi:TIGR03943 family putative permease subunit [Paenibacillus methanolicus]|uniref:Putative repeat protein (TIGR03943 family) n=1 Tax=Paenibacillus methanolicus TaxID=582686 RepID=A0A5S5CAI3_9BACL|nr:TIGR03943 family protein [Paenibacillus methanolicus]TYP76411.1 putative repeat protein (TIGR03943 family) [Paenibacillus methanolicus]